MRSSQNKTRQIALSGLLFALAMALSFAESAIAPMLGLMPGDVRQRSRAASW